MQECHGITGKKADELLAEAHRVKRKTVRIKALVTLICSGLGLLFSAGIIGLQFWGRFVVVGVGSVLVLTVGFACLVAILRNFWLLLTGKLEGSVD